MPIRIIRFLIVAVIYLAAMAVLRDAHYLAVTMKVAKPGVGQVFFRGAEGGYSERHSTQFEVLAGAARTYRARISWLGGSGIHALRFDPINKPGPVAIESMAVVRVRGLVRQRAALDPRAMTLSNQIVQLAPGERGITFRAAAGDPYFELVMPQDGWVTEGTGTPGDLALLGLAALLLLLGPRLPASPYLRRLWGLLADAAEWSPAAGKHVIYGVLLALFAAKCIYYAHTVPYGIPPDERSHLSYVAYLKQSGKLMPEYDEMRFLDDRGVWGGTNVNTHPPLYYHLLALFAKPAPREIVRDYITLRYVNIALALLAAGLYLWIGWRENLSLLGHLLYGTFITSVPMFGYLGAAINNDTLGMIGGGVTALGVVKLLEGDGRIRIYALLGFGFALAALAKLNAGAITGIFIAGALLYLVYQKRNLAPLLNRGFALAAVLFALSLSFYVYMIYTYGGITPSAAREAFMERYHRANPVAAPTLSLPAYVRMFAYSVWHSWSGIVSHSNVLKTSGWQAWALFLLPALSFIGLWTKNRDESRVSAVFVRVGRLGFLTLAAMGAIHLFYVYSSYLNTNYLGGAQARYYFSALPFFGILGVFVMENCTGFLKSRLGFRDEAATGVAAAATLAMILNLAYADFYYFLLRAP